MEIRVCHGATRYPESESAWWDLVVLYLRAMILFMIFGGFMDQHTLEWMKPITKIFILRRRHENAFAHGRPGAACFWSGSRGQGSRPFGARLCCPGKRAEEESRRDQCRGPGKNHRFEAAAHSHQIFQGRR